MQQSEPKDFLGELPDLASLVELFDPDNRESEESTLTKLYQYTKDAVDREEILKIEFNEKFDHYLMYSPGAIYQSGKLLAVAREQEAILQQEVREITARVRDEQKAPLADALLLAQGNQDRCKMELDEASAYARLSQREKLVEAAEKTKKKAPTVDEIDDAALITEEVKAAKRRHLDAVQQVRLLDAKLSSQAANIVLHEEVIKANRAHAEAIKLEKLLSALYEAVQKRHELMYGGQRKMNDIFKADNRY